MRSRAPVALLACLAGLCATPAAASAAAPETLAPYTVDATPSQLMELHERGFDVSEGGAEGSNGTQPIDIVATPKQIASLEQAGIEAEALPIDAPKTKSAAAGDSPNPYFNVYRSYMEAGGIADEMRAIAKANPDVMKLEQIGTSTLGKPILAIKMTENARIDAGRHAARDALLGRQPRA